jgi:hypothetical protein
MIQSGDLWRLVMTVSLCLTLEATPLAQSDGLNMRATQTNGAAHLVGDKACVRCHETESRYYRRTSHHLTSQLAKRESILGSFASGSNILTISDPKGVSDQPHLSFKMEEAPDGLYEEAVAQLGSKVLSHRERIDIVFGSGVRGQTYLYWSSNHLYELPVSYWKEGHQWINSPGYSDGTANFSRRADPRCMECHSTYIKALSADPQGNLYDPASFVPGISCETCHGPGSAHVAMHGDSSGSSIALDSMLVNPGKLDRDRQIDQCALCHNGTFRQQLAESFSFLPGSSLDRYLAPAPLDSSTKPDVHGNQVGLLERSRCFLASPSMTCSTCHNVHAPERAAADYSPRCLGCHNWKSCGEAKRLGPAITHDCIDCHMPLQQTNAIVSVTAGKVLRTSIRTHWIKIYPDSEAASPGPR